MTPVAPLDVSYQPGRAEDWLGEEGVLSVFEFGRSPLASVDPRTPVVLDNCSR